MKRPSMPRTTRKTSIRDIPLKVRRRLQLPYEVQIETSSGSFRYRTDKRDALYVRTTDANFGGWERIPRKFFSAIASSSRTILDVGAYSGIYSLIALASSPTSVVHAIEPMAENFKRTMRNLSLNSQFSPERWYVHNFAASHIKTDITLYFDANAPLDTASVDENFRDAASSCEVAKAIPLDSCNFRNVDLIKIDVEGHESSVLRGAKTLLSESTPFVLFESLSENQLESCKSEFHAAGYESIVLLDARKRVYSAVPHARSSETKERVSLFSRLCREENLEIRPIA